MRKQAAQENDRPRRGLQFHRRALQGRGPDYTPLAEGAQYRHLGISAQEGRSGDGIAEMKANEKTFLNLKIAAVGWGNMPGHP